MQRTFPNGITYRTKGEVETLDFRGVSIAREKGRVTDVSLEGLWSLSRTDDPITTPDQKAELVRLAEKVFARVRSLPGARNIYNASKTMFKVIINEGLTDSAYNRLRLFLGQYAVEDSRRLTPSH